MINTASLINLLGFAVGIALYFLLFVMVFSRRGQNRRFDYLLVLTAFLGILWNTGELFLFVWKDFFQSSVSPLMFAASYSALGFLPSVVVHSSENETSNYGVLKYAAYALSVFAAILHFHAAFFYLNAPSNLALQILTVGSFALILGLLIFSFKKRIENKAVLIAALLVFAFSALHLTNKSEESYWFVELVAHQSSLPIVLVILFQDYRFAFADLFLKRALSLLFLAITAFSLYVFAASPLLAPHRSHEESDALATGILLLFWIGTALLYPFLHKFSVWLVDNIILRRVSFEDLQNDIARKIEPFETVDAVLDEVSRELKNALTAEKSNWTEIFGIDADPRLPAIEFSQQKAEIFVPTNEQPFFKIHLNNFQGGRRLMSGEIAMLEAVSFLTARKIDALRFTGERFERELREKEFTKLAAEAQLTALRSQVNPHFLFNALTTIGYLINTAPDTAFQTLLKLTKLLRKVLKNSGEFCALGEELALIENYLDIEKARFEERLGIEIIVPKDLEKLQIPSLILQPLVENAVKHGISENKDGGIVRISAKLEERNAEVFLKLEVYNSGAVRIVKDSVRTDGIGLNNVRERLSSYFGKKAYLDIKFGGNQGTWAKIVLPVNSQSAEK